MGKWLACLLAYFLALVCFIDSARMPAYDDSFSGSNLISSQSVGDKGNKENTHVLYVYLRFKKEELFTNYFLDRPTCEIFITNSSHHEIN